MCAWIQACVGVVPQEVGLINGYSTLLPVAKFLTCPLRNLLQEHGLSGRVGAGAGYSKVRNPHKFGTVWLLCVLRICWLPSTRGGFARRATRSGM